MMSGINILARLDRLPRWPYPFLALFAIGAGFFFAFFDTVIIGLILPDIEMQFHITADMATWTISSSLMGYIIGAFIISRISDAYGRRKAIFISIILFTVGSFFCAFTHHIGSLIFWRFISGMGIGAEIAVATTLIGELTPAACRGRYSSLAVSFGFLGFAIVPFVGMLLLPHHTWGWRAFFLIASISGVIIAITRLWVPESPRWLISKNRLQEATIIIEAAEQRTKKKNILLVAPVLSNDTSPIVQLNFFQLFRSHYFFYVLLFVAIWFIYYLGNYAWLTLGTSLFVDKGYSLGQSLGLVSLSSLGFIVGTIFPIYLSDKYERKKIAICILFIWTIALLCVAWLPSIWMFVISGFIAAMSISALLPILYIYTAEHFPTSVRTTCVAITDGLGHLGGAICGQVMLGIYAYFQALFGLGFQAAFTGMAITGLMTAGLVLFGKKMTGKIIN